MDTKQRSEDIFRIHVASIAGKVDRMFSYLLLAEWALAVLGAWLLTPYSWVGGTYSIHIHVWASLGVGAMAALIPWYLVRIQAGHPVNRHVIAASQMIFSSLLIKFPEDGLRRIFMFLVP